MYKFIARYQKYDISTKVALIEEYFERNRNDSGYSMSQFSLEKGIADSTFNSWVLKYRHDKHQFINGENQDGSVILNSSLSPTFIEISKDVMKEESKVLPSVSSIIKLNYKDISLEFGVNELERVMEIIRRW